MQQAASTTAYTAGALKSDFDITEYFNKLTFRIDSLIMVLPAALHTFRIVLLIIVTPQDRQIKVYIKMYALNTYTDTVYDILKDDVNKITNWTTKIYLLMSEIKCKALNVSICISLINLQTLAITSGLRK